MKFNTPVLFFAFIFSVLRFISAAPVSHGYGPQALRRRSHSEPIELEARGFGTKKPPPFEKLTQVDWAGLDSTEIEKVKTLLSSVITEKDVEGNKRGRLVRHGVTSVVTMKDAEGKMKGTVVPHSPNGINYAYILNNGDGVYKGFFHLQRCLDGQWKYLGFEKPVTAAGILDKIARPKRK